LLLSDARSNMLRYPQETSSPRIEISSLSFENSYDHREQIIVPEILLLHLPRSQHVRYLHDPPMIFLPPLKNSHDPTTPRASASFGYYHYQTAISWGLGGPRTRTSDCHQSTASVTNQAPPTNSPRGTRTIATPSCVRDSSAAPPFISHRNREPRTQPQQGVGRVSESVRLG
jgi:hypothetical protein